MSDRQRTYPPELAELLRLAPLAPLGPGKPVTEVRQRLEALEGTCLAPAPDRDRDMLRCCLAGLWLAFDHLDESHALSQQVHTAEGSFWHAIMHRREPDAANSKYWWRRVGEHPVLDMLREKAPALGHGYSDPFAFVDFVERVRDSGSAEEERARRVQKLEWQLLFDWCYQRALAG